MQDILPEILNDSLDNLLKCRLVSKKCAQAVVRKVRFCPVVKDHDDVTVVYIWIRKYGKDNLYVKSYMDLVIAHDLYLHDYRHTCLTTNAEKVLVTSSRIKKIVAPFAKSIVFAGQMLPKINAPKLKSLCIIGCYLWQHLKPQPLKYLHILSCKIGTGLLTALPTLKFKYLTMPTIQYEHKDDEYLVNLIRKNNLELMKIGKLTNIMKTVTRKQKIFIDNGNGMLPTLARSSQFAHLKQASLGVTSKEHLIAIAYLFALCPVLEINQMHDFHVTVEDIMKIFPFVEVLVYSSPHLKKDIIFRKNQTFIFTI